MNFQSEESNINSEHKQLSSLWGEKRFIPEPTC